MSDDFTTQVLHAIGCDAEARTPMHLLRAVESLRLMGYTLAEAIAHMLPKPVGKILPKDGSLT
jgi:hypothetical protein